MTMTKFRSDPLNWLKGVAFATSLFLQITGKPVPCPRPRVSKNGFAYYPTSYSNWRESAVEQLAEAKSKAPDGLVAAAIEVVGERPKKTKLLVPTGDVDNHAKGPMDALTKAGVWLDDTAVGCLLVMKRWQEPGEPAGINVWVAPMEPFKPA